MKVRVQDTGAEHFVGFHDYARRRPGDVFEIPNTPRRLPSDSEKKIIESTAKAKADYDQIKDEGGRIPQLYSFRWMEPAPGEREASRHRSKRLIGSLPTSSSKRRHQRRRT